jgi:hypothetical protein
MRSQATGLAADLSPCVKMPSFAAQAEEVTQFETRRSGSQYCPTRVSGMDASLLLEGGPRSVQRTGSQTTKARTRLLRSSCRTFSSAEAPRTQTLHVGDSSTSTRT